MSPLTIGAIVGAVCIVIGYHVGRWSVQSGAARFISACEDAALASDRAMRSRPPPPSNTVTRDGSARAKKKHAAIDVGGIGVSTKPADGPKVSPHDFTPLRWWDRFFKDGRCVHCYAPRRSHPVWTWRKARYVRDMRRVESD